MERVEDEEGKGKEFFPSDRLISRKRNVDDEDVDLQLRLGPPLNDNSAVEYSKKLKIVSPSNSDDNNDKSENEFQFSLIRTSSLSLKAEEEWKEEEELHSPKHMEAIQKRWEKMKNITGVEKKNEEIDGSSSVTVFESQPLIQGPSDVSRLGDGQSLKLVQKLIVAILKIRNENSPVLSAYIAQAKWLLKYFRIKMPFVSTRGDGSNGNKTGGLLFAYKKGEDVQIVCICHGDFLSPAEFVKHAGGGDVENPLRHIIVNPLSM